MQNKVRIVKQVSKITFLTCVLLLFIFVLKSSIYTTLVIPIFFYGLFIIIFRKEVLIVLREDKDYFKAKHPRLGALYNPLLSELSILVCGIILLISSVVYFLTG